MGGLTATETLRLAPLVDAMPLLGRPGALRERAREEGCLFFKGLVPSDAIEPLRLAVLEACRAHGWLAEGPEARNGIARSGLRLGAWDDPRWIAFLEDVLPLPEFAELGRHPAIRKVVGVLFPDGSREACGDICRVVSPGVPEHATPPHQDRAYVNGTGPLWTVWLPLGDCPLELGPLAVLPGSHRNGLLPHVGSGVGRQAVRLTERATFAARDLFSGDVLFFSGLTVHAALPNLTRDLMRISVDYRFEAA